MTFEHLANLFLNWGYLVKPEHYQGFKKYILEMLNRRRVISIINEDGIIVALITFFITNDYENLYKKGTWEIPNEDENGHQIYIDKMICRIWSPSIRKVIQSIIEDKYPQVLEGYYHRAPKDRCVKIYRRGVLV